MGHAQSTISLYLQQITKIQTPTQQGELFVQFQAFKTSPERLDKDNRQFMLINSSRHKIVLKFAKEVQQVANYQGEVSVVSKRNAGQKLFEGTLSHGVREDYGKQYNAFGKFIYQGFYSQNRFEGWGTTSNYEGEFRKGKKDGWGVWQDKQKRLRYEGFFQQDEFHGLGYLNVSSEEVRNFLQQNTFLNNPNIFVKYVGEWKKGKPNGQGKLVTPYELYTGYFIDGLFEGEGKLVSLNGKIQGKFYKGQKISQ